MADMDRQEIKEKKGDSDFIDVIVRLVIIIVTGLSFLLVSFVTVGLIYAICKLVHLM